MKRLKRNAVFFSSGGIGYGVIEIIWRGYTHWTMMIAGGICFMIFSEIAERCSGKSLFLKATLCALCVTGVELIFGIVFNIILKMNVWDYSTMPLNFLGQICPFYTLLWGILGLLCLPLARKLNERI